MANALIIYYSLMGRTAQAAKFIKKGLEAENVVVESKNVHKAQAGDLVNTDIIVIGSPVHIRAPAMELRRFLNKLPENALAGKKVAIFMTYFLSGFEAALSTVEEIARDLGATGEFPKLAQRASFFRSLLSVITGSTEAEEAWVAFGKLIATS